MSQRGGQTVNMNEFATHAANTLSTLATDAVPPDVHLTIEQRIVDGDRMIDQFHVRFANGTVEVTPGPAAEPDLTIQQDVETARALRAGEIHAQRAFLTGRLSIDGDIDSLLTHGELLADLLRGGDA